MRAALPVFLLCLVAGCAGFGAGSVPDAPALPPATNNLAAALAGSWDNNAQVQAARQADAAMLPVHMRQHIEPLEGDAAGWLWQLDLLEAGQVTSTARWRYTVQPQADGGVMLVPARLLGENPDDGWAKLVPCALHEVTSSAGNRRFEANQQACSTVIGTLEGAAALLPLQLGFDGRNLRLRTYVDMARGPEAQQHARRVKAYRAWVAINGAGPDGQPQRNDWHMQRDLPMDNQGRVVSVRYRDGSSSGYSLKLETLFYAERNMRVLRLSVIVDASGQALAYAWADPDSSHIGLNLRWLQVGVRLDDAAAGQ